LTLLAAIWGASFLFMRLGAHEFGAVPMAGVRVIGASLMLLPLLAMRQGLGELRSEWRRLLFLGLLNSALPFVLFGFAALSITAGMSSILNATTPLWGALVAWLWLSQGLALSRLLGMALGFAGVLYLSWDQASFKPGGSGWAIVACLLATLCYGTAANFSKQRLGHISPLAVATGSQLSASVTLAVPSMLLWPATSPGLQAWVSVALLAVLCSGVAYILYFRLMARIGPTNTMSVTFLLPVFAVLWGYSLLGEIFTMQMALGCGIVLLGTALAVGVPGPRSTARVKA
jgi:drug/metabolite transporter (DMT)-like permease